MKLSLNQWLILLASTFLPLVLLYIYGTNLDTTSPYEFGKQCMVGQEIEDYCNMKCEAKFDDFGDWLSCYKGVGKQYSINEGWIEE